MAGYNKYSTHFDEYCVKLLNKYHASPRHRSGHLWSRSPEALIHHLEIYELHLSHGPVEPVKTQCQIQMGFRGFDF